MSHTTINGKNHEKFEITFDKGSSDILVVSFAGLRQTNGIPHEEFKRTLKPLEANLLFIADKTTTWHNNLEVYENTKTYIDYVIEELKPSKVIFLGLSMGGFAAIIYAAVCRCDIVIAFSPQIDIDPELTGDNDTRYDEYVEDVKNFIFPTVEGLFNDTTTYHVIYGTRNEIDKFHMNKVPNKKNINMIIIKNAWHNVPRYLKEIENRLQDFLKNLIIG